MIKDIVRPFYDLYRRKSSISRLKRSISRNQDLRIVIGSSGVFENGWIPTERHFLDLLKPADWTKYFKDSTISIILAEHVWEHLSYENGTIAAETCFRFLKSPGGKLRIAVPDGLHPSKEYIDYVKPGGGGFGADDHQVLYNYKTMSEMLSRVGFKVLLLEYFDEAGIFHNHEWDKNEGFIRRSQNYDKRNGEGKLNYTSLIIDAVKI